MNYVSSMFSTLRRYYGDIGINEATLTGAIDVIVIEQDDGSFNSSPFHVRFGKIGILMPKERIVDLTINGELVQGIEMRVGLKGEGYFVFDEEAIEACRIPSRQKSDSTSSVLHDEQSEIEKNKSLMTIPRIWSRPSSPTEILSTSPPLYLSDNEDDRGTLRRASQGAVRDDLVWTWGELPQHKRLHTRSDASAVVGEIKDTQCVSANETKEEKGLQEIAEGEAIYLSELVTAKEDNPELLERYLYNKRRRNLRNISHNSSHSSKDVAWDIDHGYRSDEGAIEIDQGPDILLSLCGGLDETKVIDDEKFNKDLVLFEEFVKDPEMVLKNPNAVVKWNGKCMSWPMFSVQVASIMAYQHPLNEIELQRIFPSSVKPKKNSGITSWWSWRSTSVPKASSASEISPDTKLRSRALSGNDLSVTEEVPDSTLRRNDWGSETDLSKKDESGKQSSSVAEDASLENINATASEGEKLHNLEVLSNHSDGDSDLETGKTIRLDSEKIKLLKLNYGVNELVYSITTKYQGTTHCKCCVYLWKSSDRIVVSDIDGTITKSDVWGHLFPLVGLDWTQSGIVRLYNEIERNDYKLLYLSARSIGQAQSTRDFLQKINQDGLLLPEGPLLLCPSSLLQAFRKEVIEKKPYEFKISCLRDVCSLFSGSSASGYLYAGFGNKPSDVLTYRAVGIEESHIFTVNPKGCVLRETGVGHTTYLQLGEIASIFFPSYTQALDLCREYANLPYWQDKRYDYEKILLEVKESTGEMSS